MKAVPDMASRFGPFQKQLAARWQSLAARERALVVMASTLIGLALFWWILIAPALQTLRTAAQQRSELDQQLQSMRGMQAQAKALQSTPKLNQGDTQRALEAAVQQRLGASGQISIAGERATVTLKGASPDALAQWLAQARVNAHALPVETHLVRNSDASAVKWDGTVVLRLP